MAKRRAPDWEALEREYRTGCFSNRQLGDKHGCTEGAIRSRAKRFNWQKDLTNQVRKATQEKLLREGVRTQNAEEDAAIIEDAAATRAAVVLRHRGAVARDHDRLEKLSVKLDGILKSITGIKEIEAAQSVLESMARTRARLIPLERQAFNLGDGDSGGDDKPSGIDVVFVRKKLAGATEAIDG